MNETFEFTINHLRFEAEALTTVLLPAHAGPAIRGALWGALQRHFCPAAEHEAASTSHRALCPVCWLMATDDPQAQRGRDVPRPYTVEPPVAGGRDGWQPRRFESGERLSFGLTLFARALHLFPYLVVAMPLMGEAGIGIPLEENASHPGRRRRGQFAVRRIEAVNPMMGGTSSLMGEGQTLVQVPEMPVTAGQVLATAEDVLAGIAGTGRLQIRFITPMRIVEAGRLVHRPWLEPMVRRLLERLDALRGAYADEPPVVNRDEVVAAAARVRLVRDSTRWLEVKSGSRRLGRATPVSGYVGRATYQGEPEVWRVLMPYLIWGQEIHVGKNATKGDGWYEVLVERGG